MSPFNSPCDRDEYSERLENYFIEATEDKTEEALIVGYQPYSVVVQIIRKSEEMKNV